MAASSSDRPSRDELQLEAIAAALHKVGLDAVVVGSTASILNGAPVLTQDVDLLVRDTPRNRQKLVAFAEEIGGSRPQRVSEPATVDHIFGAPVPVDIVYDAIAGGRHMRFASVKSRARRVRIGRHELTVAALEDVIQSKRAAGRDEDRAVLPILEDTLRVRKLLNRDGE